MKISSSMKTYLGLIGLLSLLAALSVFLPQGNLPTTGQIPAPKWVLALVNGAIMLVLYGGLGWLGLVLARKVGFAGIWDPGVSHRKRFLLPAATGLALGVVFILADSVFAGFHGLGPLPHPPFPTSLVASVVAGIGEEVIFRLFFVSLWVWLVAQLLLKGRRKKEVFWIVAVVSGVVFGASHLPSVMFLFDLETPGQIPGTLLAELLLLNGLLSVVAADYLRRFGFLAAVGLHFWTDLMWHVVWGAI